MAGAGYKDFTAGDVFTAAQVDTYLMEQSVMVFATAAARDAALTTVKADGMFAYLTDAPKRLTRYNGSAWNVVWSDWVDFTPTFTNMATSATDGAYRYAPGGMWVKVSGTCSGAGSGNVTVTLPDSATSRSDGLTNFGWARYTDASSTDFVGIATVGSGSTTIGFRDTNSVVVAAATPFTWASGDTIEAQLFVAL